MNFTVVGAGYVGLSLAVLISQKYKVNLIDIDEKKVAIINSKKSPIKDHDIQEFLSRKKLNLKATSCSKEAYKEADFLIIATPTNYDVDEGKFDTSSVERVINDAFKINPNIYVVIKSTIPLGFTNEMKAQFNTDNICFSPEFLREGSALYDNLFPSRIIVGDKGKKAKIFSEVLCQCSNQGDKNKVLFMNSLEAEAVKLFSNTFLAMRVSFFNELDTYSQVHKLSTKNIINGVSSDPRIGDYYNNPSFGYGGYCLPKDTKQLLKNFDKIPSNLIKAIIDSNKTRKEFIANSIINFNPKSVGVYRLAMKTNSDNFRESAVFDVIHRLQQKKIRVYLYEPELESDFEKMSLINEISEFITKSDVIIANRMSKELEIVKDKVFTRDLFGEN